MKSDMRSSMKSEINHEVSIPEGLQVQDVCGERVLLHVARETYYRLDESSARVWKLLQQHRNLAAVRDAMAAESLMDPVYIEAELLSQIDEFAEAGLITLSMRHAH